MKDFFLYKTELAAGDGFQMFGVCHLLWLLTIGIFSWYMGRFFSFTSELQRIKLQKTLGIVLVFLALCRVVVLMILGHYHPEMYGLHLCNMAVWFAAIYMWTKNRFIGVVFVLLCLPAAALALIFPGWLCYPFWNFMHIYNFVYHGIVVAVGWSVIRSCELVPTWKELWKPLVFGLTGYVVLSFLNPILDTNFWFINKPSGQSPLAIIYNTVGEEWYLAGHFLFCMAVVVCWTGVVRMLQRKQMKNTLF